MAYCITPTILSVPVCPVVDEYFRSELQKEMVGVYTLIMHCDLPSHLGIARGVRHKGVSRAYKLWVDLRPRGQSLDRKILLQHCIDEALASFIAKILLDP